MGAWGDTQAAYFGQSVTDSERPEKCINPDFPCTCCLYALSEELGYNNHKTYCMLCEEYV